MCYAKVTPEEAEKEIKIIELMEHPITSKILKELHEKIEDSEEILKMITYGLRLSDVYAYTNKYNKKWGKNQ